MPAFFDDRPNGALDLLLQSIASRATKIYLLSFYSQGQSHADMLLNVIGSADIDSDNFDPTTAGANNSRVLRFTGVMGLITDTSNPTDRHVAIASDDTILNVTDDPADQIVTQDQTVNFGAYDIHALQPVAT